MLLFLTYLTEWDFIYDYVKRPMLRYPGYTHWSGRAKKTVVMSSRKLLDVSLSNTASSISQRGRRRSPRSIGKKENADPRDAAKAAGEIID